MQLGKEKHFKRMWTNIFGLKVGDKVKVYRRWDNRVRGYVEGEIIAIITKFLSSHYGPYEIRLHPRHKFGGGVLFCRIEELEKIEGFDNENSNKTK